MDNTKIPRVDNLILENIKEHGVYHFWLKLISDPFGSPMSIPLLIAKGKKPGKVLGITAALHGDEINGIPVIHNLFKKINTEKLSGTVIACPVVNIPAYINHERRFIDSVDLNHIMPGQKFGNVSQVYAYRFFNKIVTQFDYLIDLHTASAGRINSYYIRADMSDSITAEMARLQNAQLIVHNPPHDNTLRGAASALGIPSITLEVGNPNIFQKGIITDSFTGIFNVLNYLEFIKSDVKTVEEKPIICSESYWIYTGHGGILRVFPSLLSEVKKGDKIATLTSIFGFTIEHYFSENNGVVIGKSTSPVNQTGGRILHLGIKADTDESYYTR